MIPSEVKTREFWLGAGSAVVAGLVGFLALLATCTATDAIGTDYSVTAEYHSPSGEKRAIVYVGMGGGAAGWCFQQVAIVPEEATFDPEHANAELNYVFSADCGNKIRPTWLSNRQLEIAYSISEGVSLYQRPATRDGSVHLSFHPSQ